jgi:type I restriction enzyme, S subunit
MTDGLKEKHRKAIIEILAANERVQRVFLFGSRAMRTHTTTSDVDLALYGDNLTLIDQAHLSAAIDNLPMAQRVDLLLYNKIDNEKLKEHIERYGQEWFRRSRSMSADWPLVSLAELYEIRSGLSKPAKDFGTGFPFLSFKDVFHNFFVPDRLTELVQANKRERESCSIKRGDVFLTRTSETINELGMSCVALKDYEQATFNGFTKRLRPKIGNNLVPEYVGYYLRSPCFRKEMMAFSTLMSTRASLNNEMISRLKVLVPPRDNQEVIAHILKSLDDKIELNRQINQTLEEMAQAIFKSWFVDFDPVKAKIEAKANGLDPERAAMCAISGKTDAELNGLSPEQLIQLRTTAALFPDELTDSEQGQIPNGWTWKSLDITANFQNGLALQKHRPEDENDFLPIVKIAQLKTGEANSEEKASPTINPACVIDNGDVVFSWSGSLVADIWCGGKAALNQHLFKVTSDNFPKWFFYYWTKYHLTKFQQIATDKAVTMGHIKRSHLKEAMCIVPVFDLKKLNIMADLIDRQIAARLENRSFVQIRDTLLPKLLSGEISVMKKG